MSGIPQEITELLLKWNEGEEHVLEQLVPLVYPELKRLARRYMRRESPDHTLQTSALINEAYLRLVDQKSVEWKDRGHFFAVASTVMRHILVDHARSRNFHKRGGGAQHLPLDEVNAAVEARAIELVELDQALTRLTQFDSRKSRIVELKFFGGLTFDEIAEVLGLSTITIKREWRSAKAWLYAEIERS